MKMAAKVIVVAMLVAVSVAVARARPEELKKDELSNVISQSEGDAAAPAVTVPETSTLTTGAPNSYSPGGTTKPAHKPDGSGFARLIDDIFQIPISVLRAVNTLLTNPFSKNPQKST